MIIKEEQNNKSTAFRNLQVGDIFKSGDRCYIKIEPIRSDAQNSEMYCTTRYNAVALESGMGVCFSLDTVVTDKPFAVLLVDGEQ